jgi:cation:H+ antiporter
MAVWILFFASAAVIAVAGTKLCHYGDRIAELTGLGRLWIGVVLMAAATSLPEVFTTVSAALMDAPDLAAGDLFGAGMSNMLTLGIIDLLHRQKRVWQQAAYEQTLVAALAMALTGLAGAFILLKTGAAHGGVGLDTALLFTLYVLGMRVVYRQEDMRRRQQEQYLVADVEDDGLAGRRRALALRRSFLGFAAASAVILVAAPLLAGSAKAIADVTGISTSFIGTTLVAVTTSFPELAASLAAVRLGAFDLAVGNLFGSNAFNMAALFLTDVAYREGTLLSAVSPAHVMTALWSMLLMSIGLMGIIYRAEKRFMLIEPDSFLIIMTYVVGIWLLFR